jgi:Arc/MetJ-type ribon-helix-helix transcriptional regulator
MPYNSVRKAVYGMVRRLEMRLDDELYEDLAQLAAERQISVSAVVREAIRLLREAHDYEARKRAVDEIAAMKIEEMPDPDELARQMDSMYDLDLP